MKKPTLIVLGDEVQAGNRQNTSSSLCENNHPQNELAAAVNSFRLARRVKESLKTPIKKGRYLTYSSAVLGMLKTDAGKFHEFVGVRMRSKSQ